MPADGVRHWRGKESDVPDIGGKMTRVEVANEGEEWEKQVVSDTIQLPSEPY